VAEGSTFCPFCGSPLRAASPPSAPTSSVASVPSAPPPQAPVSSAPTVPPIQPRPPILLLTSNYAAGYKIDKLLGIVYGITLRSRGIGGNIIAGLRTTGGGDINQYTEMAHQARQQALDRMADQARSIGGNAVLSIMFDSTEMGTAMDEIIAFGTAAVLSPLEEDAQRELVRLS
jgi:uncharacterized protein YbjQ (UPF0145 family)